MFQQETPRIVPRGGQEKPKRIPGGASELLNRIPSKPKRVPDVIVVFFLAVLALGWGVHRSHGLGRLLQGGGWEMVLGSHPGGHQDLAGW